MPVLRLFAAAREAAGVARAEIPGTTVAEILEQARGRYGHRFSAVLARSRVWVNGEPASEDTTVEGHDVVAVLPPVSGGAGDVALADSGSRPADGGPSAFSSPSSRGTGGSPRSSKGQPPSSGREGHPAGAADGRETGALGALGGLPREHGAWSGPAPAGTNGAVAPTSSTYGQVAATAPARAPGLVEPGPPRSSVPLAPEDWKAALGRLAVAFDTTRPHGRIGVLWATLTVVATVQGQAWLAGWLGVTAFVGGSQAAGARRALGQRPPPALAAVLAAAAPAAAVYGVRYLVGTVGVALVLALVTATLGHGRGAHDLALALTIGAVTGAAAAAVVVTRDLGIAPTLFLLACTATYDAGAYVVGTGASSSWEGPVAGVAALIPVTLIGAIILSPPFPSGTPLGLGALAGFLAPLGPLVGTALIGTREADTPGIRRLDSLILIGPAWAWWSTTLLR